MNWNLEPSSSEDDILVNIADAIGATDQTSIQILTLYIPSKDRHGYEITDQRRWVKEGAILLAEIGGGVTIMPPVEGGWMNEEGEIIWEQPIIMHSYVKPDSFISRLPKLRDFLHRLGSETNQGEVAIEFDGHFYRITEFDRMKGGSDGKADH